ncbi:MAG: hypothetical protein EA359_06680 [Balneolaceae bacterium]|nr:MAG: hypothetical protein EA359_06680 [Balneolaceae bacterium]
MKYSFLTLLISGLLVSVSYSQINEYQQANRLMQQQKYEEALPIFEELYRNNPRSYVFFDHYTECLINLKMFDEAERVTREQIRDNRYGLQSSLRLAEIFHLRGDRNEAYELWMRLMRENRSNIQAYYTIGSSMLERQEYDAAIELYRYAQEFFRDETMFLNELANTYMQAGRFEESVKQYFRLIINSPDQMSLVQQRFLRMRDNNLYQVAAFELEDQLIDLDINHKAYPPLYQLLAWLLLETEEFQRAFVLARQYENRTGYTIYSLFALANQFLSARQFELAIQAYEYYLEDNSESVRIRASEELAVVYTQWVQYLQQNNLETERRYNELKTKAYNLNEQIIKTAPNYDRIDRVFSRIIDLSIDFYKDIEKAEYWFREMKNSPGPIEDAFAYYAEGRIAIFKKDFVTARQTLTRADRSTDNSNLSERARYYLSLSDFFAGDFEFADIQLRSLERRHTSFYANDAIKLRMWIKNGKRADTTGTVLRNISESLYNVHTGMYENALDKLEPILANSQHPFADDLLVELNSALPSKYNMLLLSLTDRILGAQPYSPLKERMMWDKAILIETYLMAEGEIPVADYSYRFLDTPDPVGYNESQYSAEDRFFRRSPQQISHRLSVEYLAELLEDIIIEFPDGFYAPFVREKIQFYEISSI